MTVVDLNVDRGQTGQRRKVRLNSVEVLFEADAYLMVKVKCQ